MWGLTLRDRRSSAALVVAVLPLIVSFGLLNRSAPATLVDAPTALGRSAAAPLPVPAVTAAEQPVQVGDPAQPDDPAQPGDPVQVGLPGLPDVPDGEVLRLASAGRQRAVLVQDPPSGTPARALLVVLGPHALTVARSAADLRFDALRERGWAIAYPSTVDGDWNAGRCCGSPQREGVDDVRFLTDVRGLLTQRYDLDGDDVALAGYSTGGQMAYRVACEHPRYARALLVVAGSLETDCAPEDELPATLVVHGDADTTVPWAFATRPLPLIDFTPTPLLTSFSSYARAGGCAGERRDTRDGRLLLSYERCTRARSLTLAGMPDQGHGWDALRASVYAERFLPGALGV